MWLRCAKTLIKSSRVAIHVDTRLPSKPYSIVEFTRTSVDVFWAVLFGAVCDFYAYNHYVYYPVSVDRHRQFSTRLSQQTLRAFNIRKRASYGWSHVSCLWTNRKYFSFVFHHRCHEPVFIVNGNASDNQLWERREEEKTNCNRFTYCMRLILVRSDWEVEEKKLWHESLFNWFVYLWLLTSLTFPKCYAFIYNYHVISGY